MKRILLVAVCLGALVLATGCHTMKGVGQDVQASGEALSNAASK